MNALTGDAVPHWLQFLVIVISILGVLGGAAAFLFVMWPAIRAGERRARRLEEWMDSDEGKRVKAAVIQKVTGPAIVGERTSPEAFLKEDVPSGDPKKGAF
jgi:hypothetical protein